MPRQREVFRIEELCAPSPSPVPKGNEAARHAELLNELRTLREALRTGGKPQPALSGANVTEFKNELGSIYEAVLRTKQEIATLMLTGFTNPEMGRVSLELNAVVDGTASATHRILQASEEIEEAAKTLSAAVKSTQNQNLARDILDQVTEIFEACNFQDIAGQRITKVTNTLKFIEEHILRLIQVWGGIEQFADVEPAARAEIKKYPKLVNGPVLEGDQDSISQHEIDALFARS